MSEEPPLIDRLREAVPPRRNNALDATRNKAVPCHRVNKAIEERALNKAFTRHGAKTPEQQRKLVEDMLHGFREITRYRERAAKAREFVSQPRHLSVWLNSDGWMDEFPVPSSELLERAHATQSCAAAGCDSPATVRHNLQQWLCAEHHRERDPWYAALRSIVKGLLHEHPRESGESWPKWSKRVMKTTELGAQYLRKIRADDG